MESVEDGDEHAWLQMRRELEDVGITAAMIEEHREFIVNWIEQALTAGKFEETSQELAVASSTYNSVDEISLGGMKPDNTTDGVRLETNVRTLDSMHVQDAGAFAEGPISAPARQLASIPKKSFIVSECQAESAESFAIMDAPTTFVGILYKNLYMDLDEGHTRAGLPYQVVFVNRPYQLRNPATGGFLAIKRREDEGNLQSSLSTQFVYRKGRIAPYWYLQDQPCGSNRLCAKISGREYALCKSTRDNELGNQAIVFSTGTGVLPNDDWTVEYLGGQTANFYVVKHSSSATCLDVSNAGVICTEQFTGRVTQLWCLLPGSVVTQARCPGS